MKHLFFLLLEDTSFLARRHEHLQLFLRVHHRAAVGAVKAERLDHGLRGAVHQANERGEDAHEQLERSNDPHRGCFRPFERDPFRRQLAEDDLERCDDEKCQRHRDAVRCRRCQIGRQ